MTLQKKAKAFIAQHSLLATGDAVLVAVSGGSDSVALLHILHDLRDELRLNLEVAHLQHGIRGEEAREDSRFVAALAQSLNLPFHLKEVNIPGIKVAAGKGNVEQLARQERYRFFAAIARERKVNKVATAHTLDDQAETVLMWFLRGCGAKGLAGMSPLHQLAPENMDLAPALTVVRPFLGTSKAEILDYIRQRQLVYRTDKTNEDPALLRNWIRLRLLPQISGRIDARWPARLAQQAALLRDEDGFLDRLARAELEKLRRSGGLDRDTFSQNDQALKRRILRLWIADTRGHLRGFDYRHVEELLNLIERGAPQACLSVPGGWELVNEYKIVKLKRAPRKLKGPCYSYRFDTSMVLNIPQAGVMLESKRISVPPAPPASLMEGLFDAALLPDHLTVRNFRSGDRFQPLGMVGHKKVKDLLIEKKVPLSLRSVWPILLTGDEVLWIPAYGRSETAKIGPRTKEFLYVKATPLER
ncbi:MAG: tRNA lysidine(34) synthetase TilS [Alphaproteobacteria bacterium]